MIEQINAKTNVKGFFKTLTYNPYFQEITLFIALIIISIVLSFLSPYFFTIRNFLLIIQQVSITTIVAFGMAFIIISQGIDLSVGAAIALIGFPIAKIILLGHGSVKFIILAIVAGILVGGFIGLINGLNIVYLKLAPFIATLAMMSIARGLVLSFTKGTPVAGLPERFVFIGNGFIGRVPISVIIMLVILGFVIYLSRYTTFGRSIYAIGGNETAARLSGINVKKIRLSVYTIGGFFIGVASVMFTARLASNQPNAGDSFVFDSITAAILGGVSLSGGNGSMLGVLIGAVVIGVINNGQAILNIDPYLQSVIRGVIVIIAVMTSSLRKNR